MNNLLKISILLLALLLFKSELFGQNTQDALPLIQPIELAENHYQELQLLDKSKREEFSWMDDIYYPSELYLDNAILFAMAKPIYLTSSQVNFIKNAVAFPANSSIQTRAELDFLLKIQEKRTPQQIKRVMDIGDVGYWPEANYLSSHQSYEKNLEYLFFEAVEIIGERCTAENYPLTSQLLQNVMMDMRIMEFAVKFHLLRARPYQLEPKLEPLKKIESPSFASGHTLWAYIQAYTFSELIPQEREVFIDLAYEIGFTREIMGVHYPSDEEVARQIAHRMFFLMLHTDKFQKDLQAAKSEW